MAGLPHRLAVPTLTHKQRVWRLYKKACRTSLDWRIWRTTWQKDRLYIRERFDANKDIDDMDICRKLVELGEEEVRQIIHFDPYIHPEAPFGSKWQRNTPPAPHSLFMTPEEEIWFKDHLHYTQNPRKPTFGRRLLRFIGLSNL